MKWHCINYYNHWIFRIMAKLISILMFILPIATAFVILRQNMPLPQNDYPVKDCYQIGCESDDACILKSFRCPEIFCPLMIFCSTDPTERRLGPSSCEFVSCTPGYRCQLKYYKAALRARCISEIQIKDLEWYRIHDDTNQGRQKNLYRSPAIS